MSEHKDRGLRADPPIPFASPDAWEDWLAQNHATGAEVWIKFAKKESGIASVTHAEALEVAISYGWIDGQAKKLDDNHWVQRFTPRRPRSKWSKINRDIAIKLMKDGAMKPAGLREVKRAKMDGRWAAAYDSPLTATIPEDLQRELDKNAMARKFFETLDGRNRYAILYRIQDAKKPETRAARISKLVALLAEGKKLHP